MRSVQPKKLLIINILDILRRRTDEEHRLSQKEIVDILRKEYDMVVDRKSVKRNITTLLECGYPINFSETVRKIQNKDGEWEDSYILSDFYLERDFSDSELRLLIDGLLFSKHVPHSQCRDLIKKLESLSNQYFKSRVKYINTPSSNLPHNPQLFYTLDILDEAITKGKQVTFSLGSFGLDKRLHPKCHRDGTVRIYTVSPYQIVTANGRYYLIGNGDGLDYVSHYRLDRILNIDLSDKPVKAITQVEGLENGLNLTKHMAEHVYMFSGETVPVTFRMKTYLINDCIDWFGTDVVFFDETEDEVSVRVMVKERAMRRWALQYALHTKVLSPASLAAQIKEDMQTALGNYED